MGVKVTKLEIKPDKTHGNQLIATWEFDKSKSPKNHVASFKVEWYYGTGAGVTFSGEQQDVTRLWSPMATWTPPSTAYVVTCKVKPISSTHKVKQGSGKNAKQVDVAWFTGDWVSTKILVLDINLPVPQHCSKYAIEKDALTIEYDQINPSDAMYTKATHLEFRIYKNGKKQGNDTQVEINGFNKASLTVTSLSRGSYYTYRVRSVRVQTKKTDNINVGSYFGSWSDPAEYIWTRPSKMSPPNTCQAKTRTSIYLKWSSVDGVSKFDIEYLKDDPTLFDVTSNASTQTVENRTDWLFNGLEPGSRYYFRIRAVNDGGSSEWSDVVSAICGTAPSAPTTWSSETTVKYGETFNINWLHNSDDSSSMSRSIIGISYGTIDESNIEWSDEKEYKVIRSENQEPTQAEVELAWDGEALGRLSVINETYTCEIDTNVDSETPFLVYRKNTVPKTSTLDQTVKHYIYKKRTISSSSTIDPTIKYWIHINEEWEIRTDTDNFLKDQEQNIWVIVIDDTTYPVYEEYVYELPNTTVCKKIDGVDVWVAEVDGEIYTLYEDTIQTEYKVRWRIKTAGVATIDGSPSSDPLYGDYSISRENSIYESPVLNVSVYQLGYENIPVNEFEDPPSAVDGKNYYILNGDSYTRIDLSEYVLGVAEIFDPKVYVVKRPDEINFRHELYRMVPNTLADVDPDTGSYIISSFPFYIYAESDGSLQHPISYSIQIKTTEAYEDTDIYGNPVLIPENHEIFSQNYDVATNLLAEFMPSNIDLADTQLYSVSVSVSMDSGLSATNLDIDGKPTTTFEVRMSTQMVEPNVEAIINDDYSAAVHAYVIDDLESIYPDPALLYVNSGGAKQINSLPNQYIYDIGAYSSDPYSEFYTDAGWLPLDAPAFRIADLARIENVSYNFNRQSIWTVRYLSIYDGYWYTKPIYTDEDRTPLVALSSLSYLPNYDTNSWVVQVNPYPISVPDLVREFDIYTDGSLLDLVPLSYNTDILFNIYRRELDGSFVTIGEDIPNNGTTYVSDPHPALDYARYRVVSVSTSTGDISYSDVDYYVGGKSIVIQWDGSWENLESNDDDISGQSIWTGSTLILPYNIDVTDSYSPDTSMVTYIGRKNPVSYYGTQLGMTSSWSTEIPKTDTETIALLRRLSTWMGDAYVREPSGTGYWANVTVSFSLTHCEVTVPVSFSITRVEGGI